MERCSLRSKQIHPDQNQKNYNDSQSQDLDTNQSKHYDLTLTSYIFVHSDHNAFHKDLVSISPKDNKQPMNLVYLQCYFDNEKHKVNLNRIHGNAKAATDWRQAKFSVKEKIRSLSREGVK